MAEENQDPVLTTTGGTYVRVDNTSALEDKGVYLITYIDGTSKTGYTLYAMSTESNEATGKFTSVALQTASGTDSSNYPTSLNVLGVNSMNPTYLPYECVLEKETKGWRLRTVNGYIQNTNSSPYPLSFTNSSSSSQDAKNSFYSINDKNNDVYKVRISNIVKDGSADIYIGKSGNYFSCKATTTNLVVFYKKVSTSTIPFTMSHVGYATLYYGTKDVTLPEGLQAFTYSLVDKGNNKMYLSPSHTYNAGDKIPAGVGVVLTGDGGNYTLTLSAPDNDLPKYENVLKGTDTDIIVDDENSIFYRLSLNNEGDLNSVGFYWGEENGAAFVNQAHKAYLPLPNSASAKSTAIYFSSMDDNATKVIVPTQKKSDNETQYDILGRKVRSGVNGIRISKGKKLIAR